MSKCTNLVEWSTKVKACFHCVRLMFPCGNISVVHCVNFPHNSHIGYRFRLSHESLQAEACVSKEGRGHRRGKPSNFATLRWFPSPNLIKLWSKVDSQMPVYTAKGTLNQNGLKNFKPKLHFCAGEKSPNLQRFEKNRINKGINPWWVP